MKAFNFKKNISYIHSNPHLKNIIICLDKYLPIPIMGLFYGSLIFLAFSLNFKFFSVALVPLVTYALVSFIRRLSNKKRPFEVLDFKPLREHSTGSSMPSRHTSSTAVIAVALYSIYPAIGIFVGALSLIVACTRVLTGVHYPIDVLVGLIIGYLMGFVGFFIIL